MRLRKPCEHGRYDEHTTTEDVRYPDFCRGGEFLADDALVIDERYEWWSKPNTEAAKKFFGEVLDALTVRESAGS